MGLHDRKYMRSEPPKPMDGVNLPKTVTGRFILIAAIIYLVDVLLQRKLTLNLIFDTGMVRDFEVWRIFTAFFLFTPGTGAVFVAIILFIFYSLGTNIERQIGSNRFLNLLTTTSLGMAIIGLITPVTIGYIDGMLSGLFLSYGLFLGKQKMTLMLFFLIPLTLSGYALIGFTVGLIFASALVMGSMNALPMLGGCFGAYFYINLYMKRKEYDIFSFLKPKQKTPAKKKPVNKPANSYQQNFSLVDDEEEDDEEDFDKYISEKIDPILEKIATSGMSSLTAKEKKILADAKKKMGK